MSQVLSWQLSCPVPVTVNLCWLESRSDDCVNIPKSLITTVYDQVSYRHVDTHPKLCMKFSAASGSWVRCPFSHEEFQGWDVIAGVEDELLEISITSRAEAKFSVIICNRTKPAVCEPVQTFTNLGTAGNITLHVTRDLCSANICILGLRTDVTFSFPAQICNISCSELTVISYQTAETLLLTAAGFLMSITIITLLGYIVLRVYYRKKLQRESLMKTQVKHLSSEIASIEQRLSILFSKDTDEFAERSSVESPEYLLQAFKTL